MFYLHFYVFKFEDEEEEEQHSLNSEDGNNNSYSETESEGEQAGETEENEQTQVEQEEKFILGMKFCREVEDEPDFDIDTPLETDSAGEGHLRTFKSTRMYINAPPLGTVSEEEEATLDGEVAAFWIYWTTKTWNVCLEAP